MEKTEAKGEGNLNVTDKPTPVEQSMAVEEKITNEESCQKEDRKVDSGLKTPTKLKQRKASIAVSFIEKTPDKDHDSSPEDTSSDEESGMISKVEQARLLLAASKTPSKSSNKTPVKQNVPSRKRSVEGSPVTPVKHRRVELITLASPKAKMLKHI